MKNKDYTKITSLWKKKLQDGTTFLAGKLDEHRQISVLPNKFKKNPNDPDYHVYTRDIAPKSKNDPLTAPQAAKDDL
jgi:uncharacterized protein (DUF736 family)